MGERNCLLPIAENLYIASAGQFTYRVLLTGSLPGNEEVIGFRFF